MTNIYDFLSTDFILYLVYFKSLKKGTVIQELSNVEVKVNLKDCNLKCVSQILIITETGGINAFVNCHW
jgi:hypothetical protein